MDSWAFDAVVAANHPTPECGGPCTTCAFRPGTEANHTEHTTALAKLCVEGIVPFDCHEKPQLCRGFIAAVNARWADKQEFGCADAVRHREACAFAADMLSDAIGVGAAADRAAGKSAK